MKLFSPERILKSEKYNRIEVVGFLCISILLYIFLIIRAMTVQMTNDEISTFFLYIQTGDFVPFIHVSDGNNHLLNTVLTYFFYHLFGSSSFVLRLANLLFAPLYFYFCYKISEQIISKFLGWVFFLVMVFTLHIIEFHALSRGYGLSLTFLVGSLWQLIIGIRNSKTKNIFISFLYAFLSSCAILTITYSYVLIVGFSFFFFLANHKKIKISDWLKYICFGILPIIFLLAFSFFIKSNGAYFDGNKQGMWASTFKTFIMPLGDLGFEWSDYYMILLTIILIVPFLINLILIILKGKKAFSYHLIFPYLFFGNIVITIFSVKFLGLVYPGDRMAFYFYPILVGSIIFLIDAAIRSTPLKALVIFALPLLYFVIHFILTINTEYSVWYKYCYVPHRFYDKVMADYKPGEMPPSVSSHALQSNAWMFFIRENFKKASFITKEPRPNFHTSYTMIELFNFNDWNKYYDTIDFDKISNLSLLKLKTEYVKNNYFTIKNISTNGKINNEGFGICELQIDSLKGRTVELGFDLSIQSYQSLIIGGFTISMNDSLDKNLYWDALFLNWISDSWDGKPHNFLNRIVLDIPSSAHKLKINFWNIQKRDFSINGGNINIAVILDKKSDN